VSREWFYIWKKRYEEHGVASLSDLKRRPRKIRYRIPPESVFSDPEDSIYDLLLFQAFARVAPPEDTVNVMFRSARGKLKVGNP
jgi:hypothetical protein